jgi:hypothetical protein
MFKIFRDTPYLPMEGYCKILCKAKEKCCQCSLKYFTTIAIILALFLTFQSIFSINEKPTIVLFFRVPSETLGCGGAFLLQFKSRI